jgi:hypothetical protein
MHELIADGNLDIADEVAELDYVNLAMGEPIATQPRRCLSPPALR